MNEILKFMRFRLANRRTRITGTLSILYMTLMVGAIAFLMTTANAETPKPKKVILETDMTFDVDDVGALAMLHALEDQGKIDLLAVMYNEVHPDGVGAIRAINAWYGKPDLAVGRYVGELASPHTSDFLSAVRSMHETDAPESAALDVYKQVLAEQPDASVTIISVGFLNNLGRLLASDSDLIKAKVVELVAMGGRNRDRFNFVQHELLPVSKRVLGNWPTPVTVLDYGYEVVTGKTLRDASPANPVREAYLRELGDSFPGRASWDQIAVLYATEGTGEYFSRTTDGNIRFLDDDVLPLAPGKISVVDELLSVDFYQEHIEGLMTQLPRVQATE